jgi:alcohol dehydrogenase
MLTQQVKILFGAGTLSQLGDFLKSQGKKKVFVATDKGIVAAGLADKVTSSIKKAGLDFVLFDKIMPDAPANFAEEGAGYLKSENCDCVVGLGGGSTMDTTKAINMLRYNEGPILKYAAGPPSWAAIKPCPGLILIPTTAGTGSEMSDGIILNDSNHQKQTILSHNVMPEYSFLDPEVLLGVPPHIIASTGLDALSHLIEGYLSTLANDMTDVVCLAGAAQVIKWLPVAFNDPKDIVSRSHMLANSSWGGWMLANVHVNSGHSFSHVMGSMFHIAHGFGCAYAMPAVTAFNAPAVKDKTRAVGELFGIKFNGAETAEEIGQLTCDAMINFRDATLKLKPAKDWNIDRARLPEAAEKVTKEVFQFFNPREMSAADALKIIEFIFK